MDKVEIKPILIDMLAAFFSESGISKDALEYADLVDDLSMDSITFISIVVEIEDVFEITVPDNMLLVENFRNVGQIIQIIVDVKKSATLSEDKQ